MADLCDLLRERFADLLEEAPADLCEVFDRYNLTDLAHWFAEETGASYRTARRRLERYRATCRGSARERRNPAEEVVEFLLGLVYERRQQPAEAGISLRITGTVKVSTDTRHRTIRGGLGPDCVQTILDLLLEDDCDGAVDAFEECFGQENLGGQVPHWLEVDEL